MTSQGQRFRRRALRRGYKVDEVDAFLDRVEGTLAGDPAGGPVSAQEVHDVVFRVRFGGYDEWQVDLHLDRVERQLAELEERGGLYGRPMEPRSGEIRMPGGPDRMGPPQDRMAAPPERMAAPPERMGLPPERMGQPRDERMMPPVAARPVAPMPGPGGPPDPYGRYDEPGYGPEEPGRRGRADMTAEIRLGGDPTFGGGGTGAMPVVPPMGGPGPGGPPQMSGEAARVDQLRRTFQLRRFGSGYDRAQVDRLFDDLVGALSARGPVQVSDADLDPGQFALVPGGYFEAEVEAALKEVRDILIRRR